MNDAKGEPKRGSHKLEGTGHTPNDSGSRPHIKPQHIDICRKLLHRTKHLPKFSKKFHSLKNRKRGDYLPFFFKKKKLYLPSFVLPSQ
jgi:hypothetical protein